MQESVFAAVQEGNDLTSCTGVFRLEKLGCYALGNVVFSGPENSIKIEPSLFCIGKGVALRLRLRRTGISPEKRDDLPTGTDFFGSKMDRIRFFISIAPIL